MTASERQEYNRLPQEAQDDYNYQKRKHPSWNHEQLMSKISIENEIETLIGKGGKDVNVSDPATLKDILVGAKAFLERYGINIGRIMDAINGAIKSLQYVIKTGLEYIGEKIFGAVAWLFD